MMMNLSNQQKNWAFGGMGLGCFALLLSLEIATETDDVSFFDILVDAVSMLLTIGAAVGVAVAELAPSFAGRLLLSNLQKAVDDQHDIQQRKGDQQGEHDAVAQRLPKEALDHGVIV